MVTLEVKASHVIAQLDQLRRAIESPSAVMADIGQFGVEQLDETWQAETNPYGVAWPPLAPATLRQKTGPSMLIESGSMNAGLGYQVSGDGVEIGVLSDIAIFHQEGTSKMPARKVVPDEGLPPEWEPALTTLVESYLGGFV